MQIDTLRFHGVHHVDEGDLREHIATQQTSRTLGVRLPWTDPQYYDETSFRRDLDRVERYYAAHGYYGASVHALRLDTDTNRRAVDIDLSVHEGQPTRITSLWLSGCDEESERETDQWPPVQRDCDDIRRRMQLHVGSVFTEAAFDADKTLITDLLRDAGHAAARVFPHATVDPVLHQAYVVFVLRPGPPGRFGELYLHEAPDDRPMQSGRLERTHYPVHVVLDATGIRRGSQYSRTDLADAQRRLFELGAFGIVRIDEDPHRCDSHNRCDALADFHDPYQYTRVDLHIHVSPARPYRIRAGGGFSIDQSRSDLHLLGSFEHFRVPFFGRMARWRIDERPLIFTPLNFTGRPGATLFDIGNLLAMEFRVPEVWPGGTVLTSLAWDIGPDPINPSITHRSSVRGAIGVLFRFYRQLIGAAYIRAVRLDYCEQALQISCPQSDDLRVDPIFRQQYQSQAYTYLEQQLSYDARDNPLQTRHGFYAAIVNQESVAVPNLSRYSFLRGALDIRGYVPISPNVVLAIRGFGGAAVGFGSGGSVNGWPVPTELRFYSGGALSNRGYPFNQVGWRTTVPYSYPGTQFIDSTTSRTVGPNENRFTNVGGLTAWEFSTELRWYFAPFGLAFFFDASDVTGWDPPSAVNTPGQPGTGIPRRPLAVSQPSEVAEPNPPNALQVRFDPHPSTGFGIRYISPIGVVRLDIGIRLDDLVNCGGAYNADIARANAGDGVAGGYPSYYAVSRPRCDFFGLPIPLAFHFAIGEAY